MPVFAARSALAGAITCALLVAACQPAPAPVPKAAPTAEVAGTQAQPAVPVAHVELVQGTAEWRADPTATWQPVTGGFDIAPGTEIRTGPQGQANVAFSDGSRVGIAPSSQVGLELFELAGPTNAITARIARLRLASGNLSFDLQPIGGASAFEFRTDDQIAIIRGTSGTISSQLPATGQTDPGLFELNMTQGTALVGCVVQDAATGVPKINISQAGLGQPVRPSGGACQTVHSMPDPARAAGLLDAYGVALAGPPDAITSVANGDLPGAIDKLAAAWGRDVPQSLVPTYAAAPGLTLADAARKLSNGTALQILQPAVPPQGPAGPAGPLGPAGPAGPVGPIGPAGNLSDIRKLDTLEVAGALALGGESIASGPFKATSGITVTGDQPLLIDDAGGIVVGSGPATLGGGLSVRGGAGVVGDLSVTGKTQVDAIVSSGPGQLGSLAVSNDAQVQGALSVAQSAHVNGDLGVGGSAQVAAINVNGPGTVDSLTVGREASIGGGLSVANGETVGGDVSVSGALAVSGPARLSKGTSVDGARVTGSTLVSPTVEGQASVASLQVTDDGASTRLQGLDVAQAANLHGAVTAGDISAGKLSVGGTLDTGALSVQGTATLNGALAVARDISTSGNLSVVKTGAPAPQFQVAAATGDTLVGGKLAVSSDLAVNTDKFAVNASDGSTTLKGGLLTVQNAAGTNQLQVSPLTGQISVASKAGLDNFAQGELDLGTVNSTNINMGNVATGTLSMTNKTIAADTTTINLGKNEATTINLGNANIGTLSMTGNIIAEDAGTLNLGRGVATQINLGNSNTGTLGLTGNTVTADAAKLNLGPASGATINIGSGQANTVTADAATLNLGPSSSTLNIGSASATATLTGKALTLTGTDTASLDATNTLTLGAKAGTVGVGNLASATSLAGKSVTLSGTDTLSEDATTITLGATATTLTEGNGSAMTSLTGSSTSVTGKAVTLSGTDTLSADATNTLTLGGTAATVKEGNSSATTSVTGKSVTLNGTDTLSADATNTLTLGGTAATVKEGNSSATTSVTGKSVTLNGTDTLAADATNTLTLGAKAANINAGSGSAATSVTGKSLTLSGTDTLSADATNILTLGAKTTTLNAGNTSAATSVAGKSLTLSGTDSLSADATTVKVGDTASTIDVGNNNATKSAINIGNSNAATTMALTSNAWSIGNDGAIAVASGKGLDTLNGGTLEIGATSAHVINVGSQGATSLTADAATINLGIAPAARSITIGNTTSGTALTLKGGTNTGDALSADANTVTVGDTAGTIGLGNGSTRAAINIGNTTSGTALSLKGGNTSGDALTADANTIKLGETAGAITIGSSAASTINVGGAAASMSLTASHWSIKNNGDLTTDGAINAATQGVDSKGDTLNVGQTNAKTINMGKAGSTTTVDTEASTVNIATSGTPSAVNIGTAGTPNITIGNKTTNTTLSLASGKSWNVDGTTGKGTFASLEVPVGGSLTVGGGTPVTWMAEGDGTCTNGAGTINFPSTPKSSPQVVLTADGGSNLLVQVTGVKGDLSGFTFSCSQLGVTKNKTLNVPSSGLTASSTSVSASGTVTGGGGGSVTVTGSTGTPSIGGSANSAAFDLVTLDSSTASGSVHYIAMTH